MQRINIGLISLNVEVCGAGPPLLLVHGFPLDHQMWRQQIETFAATHRIIAPDLRGHGDSQWMLGGNYNQLDYVYDLAQLLHQTKMTPVTIIGHSLGGSLSLMYTGLYPENVTKLGERQGDRSRIEWDTFILFPPEARWGDGPPPHVSWGRPLAREAGRLKIDLEGAVSN